MITNFISSQTVFAFSLLQAFIASMAWITLKISPTNSPMRSQNHGLPLAKIDPSNRMLISLYYHSHMSSMHRINKITVPIAHTTNKIQDVAKTILTHLSQALRDSACICFNVFLSVTSSESSSKSQSFSLSCFDYLI